MRMLMPCKKCQDQAYIGKTTTIIKQKHPLMGNFIADKTVSTHMPVVAVHRASTWQAATVHDFGKIG